MKQPLVKRRYQRRTLAASLDIGLAKIGNRGHAGCGCDQICIGNLQREGWIGIRLVPQGLTVTADSANRGPVNAAVLDDLQSSVAKTLADTFVQFAVYVQRSGEGQANCREQRLPQVRWIGLAAGRVQLHGVIFETRNHGVDAVHTGTGHQADVILGHDYCWLLNATECCCVLLNCSSSARMGSATAMNFSR